MLKHCAVCVGDHCLDQYLEPVNTSFVGGSAINTAIRLQRQGISASYLGVVGDDAAGQRILQAVEREGVDASHCRVGQGPSATSKVKITPQGQPVFIHADHHPQLPVHISAADLEWIGQFPLVHTTWLSGLEEALPAIRSLGPNAPLISFDFGGRWDEERIHTLLPLVDIAFISAGERNWPSAPEKALKWRSSGPRLVVVTGGEQGSLAMDQSLHIQPALSAQVVDTLGAGDAFIGAFLAAFLKGQTVEEGLMTGAFWGAQACTHFGAWLPSNQSSPC